MASQPMVPLADLCFSYYLRVDLCRGTQGLDGLDRLLELAGVQLVQRELLENPGTSECATLLLFTASGPQHNIDALVNAIEQQSGVLGPVKRMRIECLD